MDQIVIINHKYLLYITSINNTKRQILQHKKIICCYKNNTLLYKIQHISNTKGPLVEHYFFFDNLTHFIRKIQGIYWYSPFIFVMIHIVDMVYFMHIHCYPNSCTHKNNMSTLRYQCLFK